MRTLTMAMLGLGTIAALGRLSPGCSSDEDTTNQGGTSSAGGNGGAGAVSTGGGGEGGLGIGGTTTPPEICNDGLDNDGDESIDEGCACTTDETQSCYPNAEGPPEGCDWGEQVCVAGSWHACSGAELPPEGEEECCTVLDGAPVHALYDAFVAAYPPATMPDTLAEVQAFQPVAGSHSMGWSDLNPGGELVDDAAGGVVASNITAGLAVARAQAETAMPADSDIVWVKEDTPAIEFNGVNCDPSEGNAPGGVGWAWGSIVYQAPDQSVGEVVYLYIGFCEEGDVEVFYYSEEPVVICDPPVYVR